MKILSTFLAGYILFFTLVSAYPFALYEGTPARPLDKITGTLIKVSPPTEAQEKKAVKWLESERAYKRLEDVQGIRRVVKAKEKWRKSEKVKASSKPLGIFSQVGQSIRDGWSSVVNSLKNKPDPDEGPKKLKTIRE
jgi:hypothetical protein